MSVKTFDFLKIQNSKLLVCEIRPVKCSIDTSAGRLKTTKWMNFQHWKELRFLLKHIADDYETARNDLKVTEDIKHGKPQTRISDSIKIAYMWALNKECCRHFLTPRKDTCWSDSEDDPISLNDKGGRFNSLQACGDMLVVSVALLNETEIQHKKKRFKNVQELQSNRVTSESAASSQYLDRSLILALDPTLVPETPNISEYFSTQTIESKSPSKSNLDESQKIKPRITTSKNKTSEMAKKSQLQQPVLQVKDRENTKKKSRSCFDTDSSSSTEVPSILPLSTSSDSQTEAAASKIFMKVPAVEIEFDNLNTNKYDNKDSTCEIKGRNIKKENISDNIHSPPKTSTNDYTQKKSKSIFSVPLIGLDQDKKKVILENIKVERPESPDDSRERIGVEHLQSYCSSRITQRPTPRISSPVDEICSETPEPYLKVGNSPTRTQMDLDNSIDLHTELITSNSLEIYSLDKGKNKDQISTRKLNQRDQETNYTQAESTSIDKNVNVILRDSSPKNKIDTAYSDTSRTLITNYLSIRSENVQNSSESDLIDKFIKKEYLFTETDLNSEQISQKKTNLINSIEMRRNRKTKKKRGIRNHNPEINRIPTKDLEYKLTDGENHVQNRNDRKNNTPDSLKHGHQKTKSMKRLDSHKNKFYKVREKAHIESESDIDNEYTDLIPHTTEEITDQKLYDFETEESKKTSMNVSDRCKQPVSDVTSCESVTKNAKKLEEPSETCSSSTFVVMPIKDQSSLTRKRSKKDKEICNEVKDAPLIQNLCKIRTRSKSTDILGMAASSPDLFDDNYSKTESNDIAVSKILNHNIEIDGEKKSMGEEISKESISQKKDLGNIPGTDDIEDRNVVLANTPKKISSTTSELSSLQCSPIFRNRAMKRKINPHQNSSLQHGSKRLKASRGRCNTRISNEPKKDLGKDNKKKCHIQESENNKKDDNFDIDDDIFNFSNVSIQSRKTLDEIMKENNGEELDKSNDDEIPNKDTVQYADLNQVQIASSQYNLDNDNDGDDEDDGDCVDKDDDNEDGDCSNDDDCDLPDLGSAQNYEFCINATEGSDVSRGPNEHILFKRDKDMHQSVKIQSVITDLFSTPPKVCNRKEYSSEAHEIYIPPDCPKASDVNYSPTPKSLLHSTEPKNSTVSNSEETNNSSLEGTLDSAESPDARRSQRIQSKKHCKRKSCCSGCEDTVQNSPRKNKRNLIKKKSKDSPNKKVIERNNKFSRNMKGKGKNKKNGEKDDNKIKKADIFDPPNSQKMTSEKNDGSNIVCDKEDFTWGQFDSTQALLDSELPDEWECDSSEVQPDAKTKKAQAEFEKMKNFKSRKKKTNTDITLFMDTCQVSKTAKKVKTMHRKSNINRNKLKDINLPKNQSKLNAWITKDSKQANPTVDEEPKASGSKDFENALCENDSLYKQSFAKSKKNCQIGLKSTDDSNCDDFNISSEQTFKHHSYEDGKDIVVNESKVDYDNITIGPLKKKAIELDGNTDYSPSPSVGDDSRLYTCGPSEQLDSSQASVQITHEEIIPTRAEKASSIAQRLVVISCAELETLVTKHLPFLKRVAKGTEDIERHEIYMQGGAAARSNTPEVIFAPFTDDQLEHVHSVLRSKFLKKLQENGIEGKEYLWMVLVPTFLIRLVMTMEDVSFEDAELLFKHMAFPKRPSRDSLGFGDPW